MIFNNEELQFIRERMEVELSWGDDVYDKDEQSIMVSIIDKIKRNPV